jgi:hypothetical protein
MWGYQPPQPPPWYGYPPQYPQPPHPTSPDFETEYKRIKKYAKALEKIKKQAVDAEKDKNKSAPKTKSWHEKIDMIHVVLFLLLMSPFIGHLMNKLTQIVSP